MSPDVALLPNTIPEIPKCLQIRTVTHGLISYAESKNCEKYSNYKSAAHTLIWAPQEGSSIFGTYKAAVMMQLRFDGSFGFPGGFIEKNEDLTIGLNRELQEELGWNNPNLKVSWDDYYNTQVNEGNKLIFHFFIKEISLEDFIQLERSCLTAKDFGSEVMGTVRVPLYTMANHYGGLPAFLNNKFVGGAKQQLLLALHHSKILTERDIEEVIYKSQNMKLAPSRF